MELGHNHFYVFRNGISKLAELGISRLKVAAGSGNEY